MEISCEKCPFWAVFLIGTTHTKLAQNKYSSQTPLLKAGAASGFQRTVLPPWFKRDSWWVRPLVSAVLFSVLCSLVGNWIWPCGLCCPNLQSSPHFSQRWLIFGDIRGTKTVWFLMLMKDPSALSSINVNKYFPQPRSIRIKDGKKTDTGKRKNQLVQSFAKKGVGRWRRSSEGKIGLSRWMNNEACFLCFKGKGGKWSYIVCVI